MQAVKLSFADLLKIEGNLEHYHIPKYQREYVWGKYHWETLYNDITENEPDYFVGSVIVVSHSGNLRPGEERIYQVIDGQQRLTTLSIFLNAIYYKYNDFLKNIPDDDQLKMSIMIKLDSIEKKLIRKKSSILANEIGSFNNNGKYCFLRVQPSTQNNNLLDYKYILNDSGILKNIESPKFYGLRRFWKAYEYFWSQLPENIEELDNLLDKINRLVFIHISVGTQSDAFTLFETLNNRGVELSPIDIIKNSLLAEMERQHSQDVDVSYDKWQTLLSLIPDFENQLRFLRQYYNAFKINENIKHERISKATKSNILQIYERLIKNNAEFTFNELLEKGELYSRLIGVSVNGDEETTNKIIELNRVGASASYTLLLYILVNIQHINEGGLSSILEFIIKYYVRRNITDIPNTRDLDAVNIEIVENCDRLIKNGKKISLNNIIDFHLFNKKAKPSDKEFFQKCLSDKIYANNVGMTRYLLWKLDSLSHTREYSPNLWQRNPNNETFIWTIEHILPEGKNIPQKWVEMIAEGNLEKAEEIQSEYVHLLGNLTLSAYNSNLSNRSFEDKQNLTSRKVGNDELKIGFKNGLSLNNIQFEVNGVITNLASIKKWDKESIGSRTKILVDKLIEIYKFDNE